MSGSPRVDVGVVTWNSRDVTVKALRQFMDSDQGCDIRLMVRDNASSDGTPEAIASEVPEAELEIGDENLGFAGGMNRLIARSDAPWFFPLNSDAWPEPGCLATLVRTAEARPRAAAVAPLLLRPDDSFEHSTLPFPSLKVALMMASGAQRWFPRRGKEMLLEGLWMHDTPRPVDWAVGAALMIPRAALEELGGFNERWFMYVEDLEWCWRAHERGWEIYFDPSAVVRHIGNVSGAQRYGERRTAAYINNTYSFYRDVHGPASTWLYRWLNVAGIVRNYAEARWKHDEDLAQFWRRLVPVYMGRNPSPDGQG